MFIWEGMRLIEERRASATISYVYEPDSYVPLARLDADGQQTEQGGLGTTRDAQQPEISKTIAASAYSAPTPRPKLPIDFCQGAAAVQPTKAPKYWPATATTPAGSSPK